ncbi:MAG: hypothetical protein CBD95_005165 [Flavobacteriales bacterium TMED235]|nr:MAG: hypothetical protein CBD95_005165 [Flavobacteriales bacterium TMED235]|tara:strand:+ start:3731 stop:4381 length:651 start_codon:yes stop_codon:yes gene_type:complete
MKTIKEFKLTPKLASTIVPVIIGVLSSSTLLFLGLFPLNNKVKNISEELNEYKTKSSELDLILNNFKKAKFDLRGAYQTKYNLINIIAGDTDLKTFFAKINSLALETSIKIDNIKPIKVINYANKNEEQNTKDEDQDSSKSEDPLITPSTFKQIMSIELTGRYDNLIDFLKNIEMMENLISINSLSLKSSKEKLDKKNESILKINLDIITYGKTNA